ncbi:MAG: tetratricopeptide repeat protein, partial [Myxococcota bacterium]
TQSSRPAPPTVQVQEATEAEEDIQHNAAVDSDDGQQRKYDEGMNRYNRGEYQAAVEGFDEFINEAPRTSNYYALALFQRGMGESRLGQHRKAIQTFRQVLSEYPESEKASEARYNLALSLLKVDPNSTEAERILNSLAKGGGAWASQARKERDRAFGRKDTKQRQKAAPKRPSPYNDFDFEESAPTEQSTDALE